MNIQSILILIALGVWLVLAVLYMIKGKSRTCCGDCSKCSGCGKCSEK